MPRPKSKGCTNCKRLKIKCDLNRPSCEYCIATRKQCHYDTEIPSQNASNGSSGTVVFNFVNSGPDIKASSQKSQSRSKIAKLTRRTTKDGPKTPGSQRWSPSPPNSTPKIHTPQDPPFDDTSQSLPSITLPYPMHQAKYFPPPSEPPLQHSPYMQMPSPHYSTPFETSNRGQPALTAPKSTSFNLGLPPPLPSEVPRHQSWTYLTSPEPSPAMSELWSSSFSGTPGSTGATALPYTPGSVRDSPLPGSIGYILQEQDNQLGHLVSEEASQFVSPRILNAIDDDCPKKSVCSGGTKRRGDLETWDESRYQELESAFKRCRYDQYSPDQSSLLKLNSAPTNLGLSPFEFRLLHHFNFWGTPIYEVSRDRQQRALWFDVLPSFILKSDLVKMSVFAYSGLLILGKHGPHVLLGRNLLSRGDGESLATIYEFSNANLDHQMARISSWLPKLTRGELNTEQATSLLLSSSMMFTVLARRPQTSMRLVNFETRENDFLSVARRVRETMSLCCPILCDTPSKGILPDITSFRDSPTLPLFRKLLEDLENAPDHLMEGKTNEMDSPNTRERDMVTLVNSVNTFNNQVYSATKSNASVPLYRFFNFTDLNYFDLVYNQNFHALRILYVYAAHAMMIRFYFVRDVNIWVDYMRWFRNYNMEHFGKWFFPVDGQLYELVVVNGFEVHDPADLAHIDKFRNEYSCGTAHDNCVTESTM
ncbi:hypothetical protein DICA1_F16446 [Diutina catenulata]